MRDAERTKEVGWEQESKERRARNRQMSAQMLTAHRIDFESKNDGSHLVITLHDRIIDFWPGTGSFTDRKTNNTGRGARNLVRKIAKIKAAGKAEKPPSEPRQPPNPT
jgi:hypothetical protein